MNCRLLQTTGQAARTCFRQARWKAVVFGVRGVAVVARCIGVIDAACETPAVVADPPVTLGPVLIGPELSQQPLMRPPCRRPAA